MRTKLMVCFRLAGIIAAVLFSVSAYAQAGYSVVMELSDKSTGDPVGFATVSLVPEGETKAVKYVLSTAEGKAELAGVKKGTYTLKVEMMGYVTFEQKVVAGKERRIDLGKLEIAPDVQMLEAATVSALGNPIVVKKDTIEYTASSFKTTDNDMLEELLKKLPGVEVGTDGSITANGETITKVMIDGKTFFLDDPQLATKNIPAKIIEKVKVVEKKSDQAQFTGIDDGDSETVIDLSIKPGMMNGWFGNVSAGGGHDLPDKGVYTEKNQWMAEGWRYQGGAMVGRFTKDSQISIILNANNSNNRGFNDLSGGMMQGMRSGGMGRGTGGWGSGNGITTSWMGGLNGNFTLLDGNMDLGGNYLYNGTNKNVMEESTKTTYKDDGSSLIYDNDGYNITNSQGHRFGVRLDHKFSDNTSILFEPQFNFGSGNFHEYSHFSTQTEKDGDRTATNDGFNDNKGFNDNWTASGFLLFRQRLGKPGRTLSVMMNYNFSNNEMNGFNQSNTRVYDDAGFVDDIVNQRYDMLSRQSTVSARAVYTEPLGRNFFLEANYSYSWNRSTSVKNTFDSSTNQFGDGGSLIYDTEGETRNDNYSNDILNRYINQSAGLTFMYQKDKLRAQLGASVKPTDTHNTTNGQAYDNTVVNWSPEAMLRYDINDNTMLRLFYFGRSSQPTTSQLMPVPDNSDPLNISFGNPYLKPYFNHNIRSMFGYTDKETFLSVHGRLGAGIVKDGITNANWYDSGGAQYSMPINGPGSGNVDMRIMVNSPIAKSKFSIMSSTYARFSGSSTYVGKSEKGDEFTSDYYIPDEGTMRYEEFNRDFFAHDEEGSRKLNLEDYFTQSKTRSLTFSERVRLTFRNDLVELTLGGRTRMSKSWYTVNTGSQNATWNNQIDASMNWTIPGGLNLVADVDYNWYNGYTTPQEDEFILNAELSKLLFKNKFTFSLKAYDILNQAKNLSVTDASNYHQEVLNNTLGRYIILSLTYRFGTFKGQGGPGGRPPHGPMGPPRR